MAKPPAPAHALAGMPEATLQLAELLSGAARRLRRGSMAQLAPLGLTFAQARVLRVVAGADTPLRMAELAAALDVVPRSATSMIDSLEAAGLVARHADSEDRRLVLVELSAAGRRLLAHLDEARQATAEQVFGSLSAADRADLHRLLSALCDHGSCGTRSDAPHDGSSHGNGRRGPNRQRGVA
jgi:DNA-binding MarR family transcriptional regulator